MTREELYIEMRERGRRLTYQAMAEPDYPVRMTLLAEAGDWFLRAEALARADL